MGVEGGFGGILMTDPDERCRAEMSGLLRDSGHEVSAVASGEEALEAARRQRPRLVILEVCLPGICGYEVCRRLRDEHAEAVAIMLVSGTRTEPHDRVAGILLGADIYFSKPLAADEFVAQTGRLICRSVTLTPNPALRLTSRERDVLRLLEQGLSHREIADRLSISHKTVGTHIEHIFAKLGVRNRMQAVLLARRHDPRAQMEQPAAQ
jgi:DNA-binding NarL/FixJ family response regulator